jgi:hypothetical protein
MPLAARGGEGCKGSQADGRRRSARCCQSGKNIRKLKKMLAFVEAFNTRENSLFDTTLKFGSLFDTTNYFLPYLTLGLKNFPYLTSPLVPLGVSVKWDQTTNIDICPAAPEYMA